MSRACSYVHFEDVYISGSEHKRELKSRLQSYLTQIVLYHVLPFFNDFLFNVGLDFLYSEDENVQSWPIYSGYLGVLL